MPSVLSRIAAIVQAKVEVVVDPDERIGRLPIDSITMAEILLEIEREFKIRADDGMLDVATVRELASYVEELADNAGKS